MKVSSIAVLKGDGIGPEVVEEALQVLQVVEEKGWHAFSFGEGCIGGSAIDAKGDPLPNETIDLCQKADAVLLGAVGGPKWDALPGEQRPEKGLLRIRSALGLYANLRPAVLYEALEEACPIRRRFRKGGIDIMVVRELTGGIYFGEHSIKEQDGEQIAWDVEAYSESEIERITRVAFSIAHKRKKRLISVDKANVLRSSRLWREVVERVAKEYQEVTLSHMYVDNAAMQLVRAPSEFDVLLTSNLFGDILSDEASMVTGSIGILPSASLSGDGKGMYEPIHGSAPDIAHKGVANPLATILSAALMLRHSLQDEASAGRIEQAVTEVLESGLRTADLFSEKGDQTLVSTREMGQAVCERLKALF